jgi:pimeloyl-ACP methyl ester carboxylesterase
MTWIALIAMAFAVVAAGAGPFRAAVAAAEEYRFPVAHPLKASLIPAAYHPQRVTYRVSQLEIRPDRRNVPRLERKHKVVLAVFAHPQPAPLVFVVPGVGGFSLNEAALMLAEDLHGMGFHAVTLPDPLSWQYALGVSESTLPGYLPLDAAEYYELLKRVAAHVTTAHQLRITGYSLVGHSFGGLLAAFVAPVDREHRAFQFDRLILINPAIDIPHAIRVVDGFFESGRSILQSRRNRISSAMVDGVIKLRNRALTDELVRHTPEQWNFSDDEMKWMIGQSFRSATVNTIFASRQIGAMRVSGHSGSAGRAPVDPAGLFSFRHYLSELVFPALRRSGHVHLSDEQLFERGSLSTLAPELRANSRLYVMENSDDFLARPEDLEALRSWLGDRLYLYPLGGHLGNLWFGKNREDLRRIMTSAAKP